MDCKIFIIEFYNSKGKRKTPYPSRMRGRGVESVEDTFLFNRKDLVTLKCESPSLLNKKDAPQDAQLAEKKLIATQYRSRAEIAQTRNLFYVKGAVT